MKLLIVEDNPEMRRMLRRIVIGLAADVTECEDGSTALAAYAQAQPDWVLMDIEMKAMDGITATRQIVAAWPQARVVIVTSHDHQELRNAAEAAGACGYVLKENLLELRQRLQDDR
jgi:CheY-like chemotaxis protein